MNSVVVHSAMPAFEYASSEDVASPWSVAMGASLARREEVRLLSAASSFQPFEDSPQRLQMWLTNF